MSGKPRKSLGARVVQAFVLAVLVALLYVATHYFPTTGGRGDTVAAVGFLLIAGTITSELVEMLKLPHLTGYILAGALAGPHVLKLVGHGEVEDLGNVNSLALALIALAGGAELRIQSLRERVRSLSWAVFVQSCLVLVGMTLVFFAARPFIPFAASVGWKAGAGIALMWGVTALPRSPSAALGILSQTRAHGPLATFTIAFVMAADILVVILFAAAVIVARPLVDPASAFSLGEIRELGHELLGSIAIGTTLGLVLALYMRLVGAQLILVLVALGFGAYEVIRFLQFDALLTFMVAGFVVQNLSSQGPHLIEAAERTGGVVYVIFFATAGAHLDLPLVAKLWPLALLLAGSRGLLTFGAAKWASSLAGDEPVIRKWGWCGLMSQAGLTLGLVVLVERAFPTFGSGFRSLAIATIAVNELCGPVLFKLGLDRAGETSHEPPTTRPSLETIQTPSA